MKIENEKEEQALGNQKDHQEKIYNIDLDTVLQTRHETYLGKLRQQKGTPIKKCKRKKKV